MTYNMTSLQASQTVSDLILYSNAVTNGMFMTMMCVAVFFISLMSLLRWGWKDSLVISGFLTFTIASILAFGGYVSLWFALTFLIITALGIFVPSMFEWIGV